MSLFSSANMAAVYEAAKEAAVLCEQSPDVSLHYTLFKTLAQLVEQMAWQLTTLWGKELSVTLPDCFKVSYLLPHVVM